MPYILSSLEFLNDGRHSGAAGTVPAAGHLATHRPLLRFLVEQTGQVGSGPGARYRTCATEIQKDRSFSMQSFVTV